MWGLIKAIGGGILAALGVVRDVGVAALAALVHALAASVVWLGIAIKSGLFALGKLIGTGLFHVADFWIHTVQPFFSKIVDLMVRFGRWLRDVFEPVVRLIDRVQAKIREWYEKYVRPIFDVIDVFRRVLGIFKAVGFEWAARLDRELSRLEEKIEFPFRFVLTKLNEIENWINRIVTLDGTIQRATLLASTLAVRRQLIGQFYEAAVTPLTPEERARLDETAAPYTMQDAARVWRELIVDDAGPVAPLAREWADDIRLFVARL